MSSPNAGGEQGSERPTRLWRWWLAAHLTLWTLVPALTQPNAPLDVINQYYWGRHFQWGYRKHPPLPPWLVTWSADLGGDLAVYLLAQVAVLACFWAAWRLGREVLDERGAVLAAVLLEGVNYTTYSSSELNHNVVLMPFWAGAVVTCWLALSRRRLRWWLALGLCLGLGFLCKYTMAVLVVCLLVVMVADPEARRVWRGPGPWLAAAVAVAVFAPHLAWARDNDWVTLRYAAERAGAPSPAGHLLHPLYFALAQAVALLPLLVAVAPMLGRTWRRRGGLAERYLDAVAVGPFLLLAVVALVSGARIRSMWAAPVWTFVGVWLLARLGAEPDRGRWRRAMLRSAGFGLAFVAAFAIRNGLGPLVEGRPDRVHFAGRELAEAVEAAWQRTQSGPVPMVGGPWFLAGNVAYYDPARPVVYGDLDPVDSPWASDAALAERGGVLVWYTDLSDRRHAAEQPPGTLEGWLTRFPQAVVEPPVTLPWQTLRALPPITIGLAVIPPAR